MISHMDEALKYFEVAFEIYREVGNRTSEGITLRGLGILFFDLSRMDETRSHFERTLEEYTKTFIELHKKLLTAGYSMEEVPWPAHWDPPVSSEDPSEQSKDES